MKLIAPPQLTQAFHPMRPAAVTSARLALLLLAAIWLSGCGVIQASLPQTQGQTDWTQATAVAAQVAVLVATNQAQSAAVQPAAVQPAGVQPQPTQEPQATYTPLPTYTMAPTWTPQPTYTPFPTYTQPPAPLPDQPTPTSYSPAARPYVLRVRNMTRGTYWIGTVMPYGGNFIKSLHYVEFYPPQPTWMRIWWCRYTSSFYRSWGDYGLSYYRKYWENGDHPGWDNGDYWTKNDGLIFCNCRDVYVDQPLIEISIP